MAKPMKKPSKKSPARKISKPVKGVSKAKVNKSKSKKLVNDAFWLRTRFVFTAVLVAAALVAISLGMMGYNNRRSNNAGDSASTTGSIFLQSIDSKDAHTAGDVLEVKLYEDSGKQSVNALQAAVTYPADKLEFISLNTDGAFTQDAATDTASPGLVRVARAIKPGDPSVRGAKPIVTIEFKVIADSPEQFELSVDNAASLLVRSKDNQNILGTSSGEKFKL